MVLFNYVDRHGIPLYEMINSHTDRPVHLVHGGVDVDDREDIRVLTEKSDDAIIVASYGTFSTGINIKRLHNVLFASKVLPSPEIDDIDIFNLLVVY